MAEDNDGVTGNPQDGYFRDPRARGLKTGRLSPRVPIRLPARDAILLANGLVSSGDVDMDQGMLFHPNDPAVRPTRTDAEAAADEGITPLRPSSAPGFMPGVVGSPGGRVSAQAQKINALKAVIGNSVLEDNTIRGAVNSVQDKYHDGEREGWYDGRAADAIMEETHTINHGLDQIGASKINAHQLRRGVAFMSAQRPWDSGDKNEGSYKVENVTNLRGMAEHLANGGDPREYRIQAVSGGFPVAGETKMPQTKDAMAKAGEALSGSGSPEETSQPHTSSADKVTTFDSALGYGLAHSQAARRHLSDAMTIDTHQARAAGQADYSVASNIEGGYDALAMINRRAILRQGVQDMRSGVKPLLPVHGQSHTWEGVRPAPRMSRMSLFRENSKGELVPNDFDKLQEWSDSVETQMTEGRQEPKPKKGGSKKGGSKKA